MDLLEFDRDGWVALIECGVVSEEQEDAAMPDVHVAILEGHRIELYEDPAIEEQDEEVPSRLSMKPGDTGTFVLQTHKIGKGVHTDLRFKLKDKEQLLVLAIGAILFLLAVLTKRRGSDPGNIAAMITSVVLVVFLTAEMGAGPLQSLRAALLSPLGIGRMAWPWGIVLGTLVAITLRETHLPLS